MTVVVAVVLGTMAVPAVAGAARVEEPLHDDFRGDLHFIASPGEVNDVTVSIVGKEFRVEDLGAKLIAGENCTQIDDHHASCPLYDESWGYGLSSPRIDLGDRSDDAVVSGIPPCPRECMAVSSGAYSVFGGDGDDTLAFTGPRTDAPGLQRLFGEAGDDIVVGGPQQDLLDGGPGDDVLRGGAGQDRVHGGPDDDRFVAEAFPDFSDRLDAGDADGAGRDVLDYSRRTTALQVALDDLTAAGSVTSGGSERDVLRGGFEDVRGGAAGDRIAGNRLDNRLDGGGGADRLLAGRGTDTVLGGAGDDALLGGPGPDVLDGLAGTDLASYADHPGGVAVRLNGLPDDGNASDGPVGARDTLVRVEGAEGGSGPDTLEGDDLANRLRGNGGTDRLRGRGGNDSLHTVGDGAFDDVHCGLGADVLDADPHDRFAANGEERCETVRT